MFIFLSLMLSSFASTNIDYTNIKKGESAPFSGKLLTDEALTQIIVLNELEIKNLKADHDLAIKNLENDLNLKYNLYESECEADKLIYQNMIDNRDKEIQMQIRKDYIQRLSFVVGFTLGAALTTGITYSVNQN